jgi:1,3-alpha-isomaltosidase
VTNHLYTNSLPPPCGEGGEGVSVSPKTGGHVGFSGEIPSAELYLRAAAIACFCPIMRYHSEYNHHRKPSRDRTPWNIQERTGDCRVVPIYRRFAQLREAMVPYLIEQAWLAVETSRPLTRALCFEARADPEIWRWPHQYLLGDDLLVAPVVEPGAQTWGVYLPAGEMGGRLDRLCPRWAQHRGPRCAA